MSPDVSTEMHCALERKIKIRPGSTVLLSEELQIPSGAYIFYIEYVKRESSLRKNISIAASGDLLITTGKDLLSEVIHSEVDFQKEHPFVRDICVPESVVEDGASEKEGDTPTIKILLTVVSTAHIKKTRLLIKLLTKSSSTQVQVISSNLTEKKKNGRLRNRSSATGSPDTFSSSGRSTPSSSFSDLPTISATIGDVASVLSSSSRDDEEIDPPRTEKPNFDVFEKDILVIQKNITFNSEGVEQNNTTQIHLEHTKTISESSELGSEKGGRPIEKSSDMGETNSSYSSSVSTSSFDASEENLVYYKEIKLRKKHVHVEKIPIQQKGKYYLVIENPDKSPITRHFSCHATLSQGTSILKESFTNDAKKKLSDDFTVETESADLTLNVVHTNSSFGKSELQVSLYMKNTNEEQINRPVHPHFRTGEVVWSVSACEVDKKHPQKFIAKIPTSGKYYIVAEKTDKIFGGLREIAVEAILTQPPREGSEGKGNASKLASVVVGGVKARPMKWKSPIFAAPAGSTVEFTVVSYAIVGSIIYSLRLRKVPGLTAEEERTRRLVLLVMATFGIYYFLYMVLAILHFIQNIGFTLNILFFNIDITLGRICCILLAVWFRTNQEILVPCLKDVKETVGKILRKIKYFRDMSDGGKFDILRIFKQMSKEGKLNDLRKWERQKLQTANE